MQGKAIIMAIFFVLLMGCAMKDTSEEKAKIVHVSESIGTASSDTSNIDEQKLTYSITVSNPDQIAIVDSPEAIFAKIIKDRLIKIQRSGMKYDSGNRTIELFGEVIFDARGLTKKEITEWSPFVKGVQFIGDDNREYVLLSKAD